LYQRPSRTGAKVGCGCAVIFAFVAFASLTAQSCAAGSCRSAGAADCPPDQGWMVWLIYPAGFAIVWIANELWLWFRNSGDR
jgi:hypothetical protein